MNEAHFHYGGTIFGIAGYIMVIEGDIAKGDISAASQDFRYITRGYAFLESNYKRIDISRYDAEHGGLIMDELKKQKLPQLHEIIE
jgi:hypothetical protein